MNLEYFSFTKGKVISIMTVSKLNITVKFETGEVDTFSKMDSFEYERYNSNREPPNDGFLREFLHDEEGDVMWVKKTCLSTLSKEEEELVEWYQQEQEDRLERLARPFNYEKDEDNFY